jgi:hypothetical protein
MVLVRDGVGEKSFWNFVFLSDGLSLRMSSPGYVKRMEVQNESATKPFEIKNGAFWWNQWKMNSRDGSCPLTVMSVLLDGISLPTSCRILLF